jgi:2-keto-3-deoxy-6-phosphogluconate aldolase
MPASKPIIEPEVVSWQVAAILREKTPAERIEMLRGLCRMGLRLAEIGARRQHPDWDDTQIADEVARRIGRGSD